MRNAATAVERTRQKLKQERQRETKAGRGRTAQVAQGPHGRAMENFCFEKKRALT